jgi:hypothetical protein
MTFSVNRKYIPEVDQIRAFAATLVLSYHCLQLIGAQLAFRAFPLSLPVKSDHRSKFCARRIFPWSLIDLDKRTLYRSGSCPRHFWFGGQINLVTVTRDSQLHNRRSLSP